MKRFRFVPALLFLMAVTAGRVRADSITDRNNVTIFGRILALDHGQLTIEATFSGETKKRALDRAKLSRIEFNHQYFNEGPPPKALALHEPPPQKLETTPPVSEPVKPEPLEESGDTIFLRDGSQKTCTVVSIGPMAVVCSSGKSTSLELVKSIRFR